MTNYRPGTNAPYGMYFSTKPIDIRLVGAEGDALEGKPNAEYRRIPTPLALALSPALGGIFVIAFPILIMVAAMKGLYGLLTSTADEHAYLAQARYAPAASYLNGSEDNDSETAKELTGLEDEVSERRDGE